MKGFNYFYLLSSKMQHIVYYSYCEDIFAALTAGIIGLGISLGLEFSGLGQNFGLVHTIAMWPFTGSDAQKKKYPQNLFH